MADITELLSEQLEKLVDIDSECIIDDNAFFDPESINRVFAWYEDTKIILKKHLEPRLVAEFVACMQIPKYGDVGYADYKITIAGFKGFLTVTITDLGLLGNVMKPKANRSASADAKMSDAEKPGKKVFIIHGHDPENLLRLDKLIRERFGLEVVVLKDAPRTSRHLIKKLEEETSDVGFVFALFTPDDLTTKENKEYYEARPNVILEWGWFCAKLGGEKVSILLKIGTQIPSDIEGIDRIEFIEFVNEELEQIEKVLKSANLIDD